MTTEDGIIEMMKDLDKCEDTVWLTEMETVLERCWNIVAGAGGDDRLRREFPHYA